MLLKILLLTFPFSSAAFAFAVGSSFQKDCSQFIGDVSLSPSGQIFLNPSKDSVKKEAPLIPSSRDKPVYRVKRIEGIYEYAVEKKDNKPVKLTITSTHLEKLREEFDIGINGKNCVVESQKNKNEQEIYFDLGLCKNLADLHKQIGPDLQKSSNLISRMADTVAGYRKSLPKDWSLKYDPSMNPFENALTLAGDCRRLMGAPAASRSLAIPTMQDKGAPAK